MFQHRFAINKLAKVSEGGSGLGRPTGTLPKWQCSGTRERIKDGFKNIVEARRAKRRLEPTSDLNPFEWQSGCIGNAKDG